RVTNQSNDGGKTVIADATRWVLKSHDTNPAGTVPAWWMTHFFGNPPPSSEDDVDGDGVTIREEYLWGTDPTDLDSRLRYALERDANDLWTVTFSPFHEGRVYRLQRRASLTEGSWQNVV